MPYPTSPFDDAFEIIPFLVRNDKLSAKLEDYFGNTLKWLCTAPKITSYRVNTLKTSVDDVLVLLNEVVLQFAEERQCPIPLIVKHSTLPNVIVVYSLPDSFTKIDKHMKEIIVDVSCAAAVLRGAHIYAPGIMGMMSGLNLDDNVSIYADISGKCRKGFRLPYTCSKKVFIGNGVVKMRRHELFGENIIQRGKAIDITETISGCPNISNNHLPKGATILQNIPSIACVYALNPQEGEVVLDMCAAPGNKTTHIAELMNNIGTLIAIDKTPNKVQQLTKNCNELGAKPIILQANSTNLLNDKIFAEETFDRILLDAPCSALGQRPQFVNNTSKKSLNSYVSLQKKLFLNAVHLLKVNGRMVYSTCTITLSENEEIVEWALKSFPCLELIKVEPFIGNIALPCPNLTEQQRHCLQRFGPEQDSIGFFIAVFVKNRTINT